MARLKSMGLTVVGDLHCPTTRTDLSYLANSGFRPKRLLLVDFSMPSSLLRRLVKGLATKVFWQEEKTKNEDVLFRELTLTIQQKLPIRVDYFGAFDFESYAEQTICAKASSFKDPKFHEFLSKFRGDLFLYTNGGIVPREIFDPLNLQFIHIHPGIVPHVRGSDGLFWSLLIRGKIGQSCFFMDAGIDTGDLIHQTEYEPVRYPELRRFVKQDVMLLRKAFLHSYDPHFRAMVLVEALKKVEFDTNRLRGDPQNGGAGRFYFHMHPRLLEKVFLEKICV